MRSSRKARLGPAAAALAVVAGQFFPATATDPCNARFCAGAARADITPPVTTPMWGYSARANYSEPERWLAQHTRGIDTDLYQKTYFLRSEGIHTRLYARALILRDSAGLEMALVQVDLGAMTGEVWRAVAQRIAPLGIERERLLISATHTHGGPGAVQQPPAHGLLVGDNYDPRVVKRTVDGIVRSVTLAHARLAPARVAVGHGHMLGASVNRSLDPHRGNPCPDPAAADDGTTCDHAAETRSSPHAIDPTVTMIRADRIDGVPLGAWTSFAAHGTVFGPGNLLFSGDNQGVAAQLIERGIAERAAANAVELPAGWQIVSAYANGAEGDIAPECSGYNDFACAEQGGTLQAARVLELYDSLGSQLVDNVELDARLDALYMVGEGGTSPVAILGAGPDCPFGRPPLDTYPGNNPIPGHGRKCPFLVLSGTGPQWFWIQSMRIGDYVLANVPGEMTVQLGRRLRQRILASAANLDGSGNPIVKHAVVVGLANDYMAYLTTPEEYDFQWYEGTFTLWGRNQGPFFLDRMGRLTDALLRGEPGPAFIEPPDTSGAQMDNASPVTQAASVLPPAKPPGTVLAQPASSIARGAVASFGWIGGQPSAEVTPDEALVTTQRFQGGSWETVFTDASFEDLLDYVREGVEDRWGTRWDVPLEAPAGTYRFAVQGTAWVAGALTPYAVFSSPFNVVPNEALTVTGARLGGGGIVVTAAYPAPDPAASFRMRAPSPTTGSITVTLTPPGGSPVELIGSYDAAAGGYVVLGASSAGDEVTVAPGGLVDAYGNANELGFTAEV